MCKQIEKDGRILGLNERGIEWSMEHFFASMRAVCLLLRVRAGFMNLLVKSGPRDFNRQDEPETEREIQKRIMGPRAAAASIKKARLVSAFTLVNKVSEN